ncbi:MAG: T9SS type A sorting domain-containing protein [Saprospiraceae bacterium]|nr:T9SS type A sorting domain-containing protein [Saprospiraceae bacterium]
MLPDLQMGRKYFWRVRSFNYYSSCAPMSSRFTFTATATTATNNLTTSNAIEITPNLIGKGQTIQIKFPQQPHQETVTIRLLNLNGRLIHQQQYQTVDEIQQNIPVNAAGVYWLQIIVGKEQVIKKIVVYE